MKKIILGLVSFLFFFNPQVAHAADLPQVNFTSTLKASWAHIDRPSTSDYEPSAMDDGQWKVWHCGNEIINGGGGDTVFYTSFKHDGSIDQSTIPVLSHTNQDFSEDGVAVCSPTVIKYSTPVISNGQESYHMFYECGRRTYPKCNAGDTTCNPDQIAGGFAQICQAISSDGINWSKHNEQGGFGGEATPIVRVSNKFLSNCQVEFTNGKYRMSLYQTDLCNGAQNYGAGHPSAVVMNINGHQEIWLYYYNSTDMWQNRGVYLIKSSDGITFSAPQKTNVTNPMKVKYLQQQIGSYPGVFIGMMGMFANNYYTYSYDGIQWIWPEPDPKTNYSSPIDSRKFLKIGQAVENHCSAPGYPGIVSDKFGIINSTNVNLFSGEGFLGASDGCTLTNGCTCYSSIEDHVPESGNLEGRGGTWALHFIQGNFSFPIPTKAVIAGDFDGSGVVNLADFGFWKNKYLAGQMSLVEFGEWKREYLK